MKNNTYILCLIIAFLGVYTEGSFAQVAVNTDGSAADTKAMLDVKSTDKGLLIPRMTTAQRTGITGLTVSQKGLLVYDTDLNSVWQYNGTVWAEVGAVPTSVWTTLNPTTIYTDKQKVGINYNDPKAALHVNGQAAFNTDGSVPDAKAVIDMKSTDKGLLIPRMTTAQRTGITGLTVSQKGLLVYDNMTNSVWQYNGTAWEEINGSGSTIWKVRNTDTVYTTNKQVGINNNYPQAPLHVMGGGFIIQGKQRLPFNAAANTYTLNASGTNSNTSPTPDSMGIIKSHSSAGTSSYGGGTNATMTVAPKSGTTPIGVRLTFTHFNTEATNDTVVIKDNSNDHSNNVVFSGATLPAVFDYSSPNIGNGFRVKFQENNSGILGTGFILKYEFIYADVNNTVVEKSVGTGLMYDVAKNALVMGDLGRKASQIGLNSTALGKSTASGFASTGLGYNTTASGFASTGLGYNTTASGSYSTALGGGSKALGNVSTAMGNSSTASGDNSTASGDNSTASGNSSTASGGYSTASGGYSTAIGGGTSALGYGTTALGYGTTSKANYCTSIGINNHPIVTTAQTDFFQVNPDDPLFIVGNGDLYSSVYSNALVLTKVGNMGFGNINVPTYRIEIPNIAAPTGQGKANAWVTYSDNRVKFNQKPLRYGLSQVLQMQVKQYDHYSSEFKNGALVLSNSKPTFGLIAQELYTIIPEMVNKPTDESKDLWSIDYDKFGPLLVKTVQEQQAQIEALKQQIATLHLQEKRIADLEKQAADFNALKADMATLKAALQTAVGQKGDPSVKTASTERK
jgi:hypothetical protein